MFSHDIGYGCSAGGNGLGNISVADTIILKVSWTTTKNTFSTACQCCGIFFSYGKSEIDNREY